MPNDIVCVSGGFDPVHVGHVTLFDAAAQYGPLTVILNSDTWLIEKKGYRIMNWQDRAAIIAGFRAVSAVVSVDDKDKTICEALRRIKPRYFAKSGDRTPESMPPVELAVCAELGIEILYNVCPHLPYSSSQIMAGRRTNEAAVWRPWGSYQVLDQATYPDPPSWKAKRLDIAPGQKISYQKHNEREEHWVIVRGTAEIRKESGAPQLCGPGNYVFVEKGAWHQIINPNMSMPLTLIEVQIGRTCEEGDIQREGEQSVLSAVAQADFASLSHDLSDA